MFKHILCPVDGSELSLEALDAAARLCKEQSAELTVCTVVDPARASAMAFGDPGMSAACLEALNDEGAGRVRDAAARVENVVPAEAIALDGQPVEAIVQCAATRGCDLIVMSSHGRTGLKRALLGSVAEGVVRKAGVPVMIVRRAATAIASPQPVCSAS